MYNNNSTLDITNSIFTLNSADFGAGIYNESSSPPTIINCTFSNNTATSLGGGMYNNDSSPTITNCIFWGDTAPADPEISNAGTSSPTVTYSDVWQASGTYPGTGNINSDPTFVAAGDFHLQLGSPCIDAGTATGAPSDDIDGNPRPLGFEFDMGAYEYNNDPYFTSTAPTTASEGVLYTYNIATTDADIPAQTLALSKSAGDTCDGTLTDNGNGTGTYTFTPDENQGGGTCVVGVNVTDSWSPPGSTDQDTTVNITETNQDPSIIVNCPATVLETEVTTCELTPSDPDEPAQPLTCSINDVDTTCTGADITNCTQVVVPPQGGGVASCDVVVDIQDDGVPPATGQGSDTITIVDVASAPYFWLGFGDERIYVHIKALNVSNIKHYVIYYIEDSQLSEIQGEPADTCPTQTEPNFTPGKEKKYTIEGVANDTTYYVRVRAVDNADNDGVLSGIKSIMPQKTQTLLGAKGESGSCSSVSPDQRANPYDLVTLLLIWTLMYAILRRQSLRIRRAK